MASRVTITVNTRDMTGPQIRRIRQNFSHLGSDINAAIGARTRQNFTRLSRSASQARRDLNALRGAIPDDEFRRLDNALQNAQRRLGRGFGRVGDRAFAKIIRDLQRVNDGFRDLDRNGQIRIRTDLSALRRADARLDAWRRMQSARPARVPVRPDVDSHRFRRIILRSLTSPLRAAGGLIGGILSDGIGQGIIGALQAAGPVVKVAFLAIIAGILAVLGSALAGLIVTALGLAFVGVAGVSAAMSKRVKDQWATTLESLKQNFAEVGEPMIPVLDRALEKLETLGDKIAPVFKKAMDQAVPATNTFIDKLFEGFERMGKAMFQPIMDAWKVFGPVFGQVLSDSMEMWGESFADMAQLVRDHSAEIEMALRIVMKVVDLIIDTITFLGEVWVWNMQTMGDAIGAVITHGVTPFVSAVLTAFESILGAADTAFSWVPGIGDSLSTAKEHFGDFKNDVVEKLAGMGTAASTFDDRLNELNKTRKLKADISSWKRDLETAKARLKSVPDSKKSKVKAEIADLKKKIKQAQAELNSLHDRTVHVFVKSHWDNQVADYFRASGGNVGANLPHAATGGNRGNKVMVGEHGPEIVDLPGGSHVRSNSDTRRFMAQQKHAGPAPVMRIEASHDATSQFLLRLLRNAIRVEGGDVQFVLGQSGR